MGLTPIVRRGRGVPVPAPLMTFELQVGGRLRTVAVERCAEGYSVTIDGRPHIVDFVHVHATDWSLLVSRPGAAARQSVAAAVTPRRVNGGFDVHIDGLHIPVEPRSGLGRRSRDRGPGAASGGPQRVAAPMPGKIVRVLVQPGQEVRARQGLVVVEAMKMENELRAARNGRVRDVQVVEGQSVEAGTLLVLVE